MFLDAIEHMIQGNAREIYIATLYFDTCRFKEESQDAAFFIDKQKIARELKIAITNHRKKLNFPITFDNGMIKKEPLKNIENFNKYYIKKYNFSIIYLLNDIKNDKRNNVSIKIY